ncbi:hypothetical protein BC830DRAFT_1113870 [Chytriomyces sp. MP71]|nr:hypothetical protein BC830DRAFT_1113870 [Chytriomyces sp. MP71]
MQFNHQVAGHPNTLFSHPEDPSILIKMANRIELAFYSQIHPMDPIAPFTPVFYPDPTASTAVTTTIPIRIQNMLHGFFRPCIMDLKLGTLLYGRDASPEKRARMQHQALTTTSGATGLRICGMKISHPDGTNLDLVLDRTYGRSLTPDTLHHGFEVFMRLRNLSSLDDHESIETLVPSKLQLSRINTFLSKLIELDHAIQTSTVKLRGASILLAYDASKEESFMNNKCNPLEPKTIVTLIDFAHSHFEDSNIVGDESSQIDIIFKILYPSQSEGCMHSLGLPCTTKKEKHCRGNQPISIKNIPSLSFCIRIEKMQKEGDNISWIGLICIFDGCELALREANITLYPTATSTPSRH